MSRAWRCTNKYTWRVIDTVRVFSQSQNIDNPEMNEVLKFDVGVVNYLTKCDLKVQIEKVRWYGVGGN